MNTSQLIKQAGDVAYELGSVVAVTKFAAVQRDARVQEALLNTLNPAHRELLACFQQVGQHARQAA